MMGNHPPKQTLKVHVSKKHMQKTQKKQGFFSLYDYSTEKILSVLVTRRSISGFYDKKLNIE